MHTFKKLFYAFLCASFVTAALGTQPAYAASIVVNTNADNLTDDGFCTLREAITTANSDTNINTSDCATGSGADVITFAADYTITLVGSQLPAITSNITINGRGVANTILQANAAPNTEVDFPPAEIIIVDQSPVQNRIAGYYDQFLKRDDVKVIFLDTAGQTISRNTAIDLPSHEWMYLFDDDSICWKECITEHRYVIEHSTADCSTGLSLAPWKDVSYIDQQNLFYRVSDVLDTGNCFIHKSALLAVGKLDMAYNKGPGADDDLGKRLYLSGDCIVLNPKAIRTHFKTKTGGLRQYGAWWRHKTTLFGPSPPPTLLYAIKKYYPKKFWFFLISIWLLKAKEKHNFFEYLLLLLLFPFKLFASFRQTSTLGLKK